MSLLAAATFGSRIAQAIRHAFGAAGTGAQHEPHTIAEVKRPAFADVPRSEVFFADTHDSIGPLGAKAQGECAINPVAPAIANALANATGVRFPHLPFTPDRIFSKLAEQP